MPPDAITNTAPTKTADAAPSAATPQPASPAKTAGAEAAETKAEQPDDLAKTLAGDGFAAKLDALFDRRFRGTRMGNDTELWNQCIGFKADVAELVAELFPEPGKA